MTTSDKPSIPVRAVRRFIGPNNSRHDAEPATGGLWYLVLNLGGGKGHRYGVFTDEMLDEAIASGRLREVTSQ